MKTIKKLISTILGVALVLPYVAPTFVWAGEAVGMETEDPPTQMELVCGGCVVEGQNMAEELHDALVQKKVEEMQRELGIMPYSLMPGNSKNVELMPSTGTVNMLVIPIGYPDYPNYRDSFDREETWNQFFEPYDSEKKIEKQSIRGLYTWSSYGKLDLTGDVMDLFKAPEPSTSYYSSAGLIDSEAAEDLLTQAINYYIEKGIDLSKYDNDGDGILDAVFIKSLRPSRTYFTYKRVPKEIENYKVSTFVVASMYTSNSSTEDGKPEDRGSECHYYAHEIGHLLGLPDNYNSGLTTGNNTFDYDLQELMGPANPYSYYINAYYKYLLGWIEPRILTEKNSVTDIVLTPVDAYIPKDKDAPRAIVLIPNAAAFPLTEFYLIEYRSGAIYSVILAGSKPIYYDTPGIVIWHVNTALDKNNQYVNKTNYIQPVYKSNTSGYGEKDIFTVGDIFSKSSFYDETFTGAYMCAKEITPEKATLCAGFQAPPLLPGPVIEISEPTKRVIKKGETSQFVITTKVEDELLDLDSASAAGLRTVTVTGSITASGIQTSWSASNNPLTVTVRGYHWQTGAGDGTVQIDIPAGAIRYNGKDSEAIKSEIIIVDNTPPEIELQGENPQTLQKGTEYQELGAIASDNLDPEIAEKLQIDALQVDMYTPGSYVVTYSVTDHAGHNATVTRTVIVEERPSHTHSYSPDWSSDESKHWHECECGERADEEAHTPIVDPEVKATCTTSGKTEGSHCSVCGYIITAQTEIPATGHDFSATWSKDGNSHWHECECGERANEKAHTPVTDSAVEATCTTPGKTAGSHCSICGYVITAQEEVPATGHSYSSAWEKDTVSHWHECATCHNRSDSSAHIEDAGTVTKQPTLEETGVKTYSCSVCGYEMRTEVLAKLEPSHTHSYTGTWSNNENGHWHECECGERADEAAHTSVVDPEMKATCTTPGKTEGSHCGVCGYIIKAQTEIIATGHRYSSEWYKNSVNHWHQCVECDVVKDNGAHLEDAGAVTKQPTLEETGIKTYSCSVCGYKMRTEILAKLEPSHTHSYSGTWGKNENGHWHECVCGDRADEAEHSTVEDPEIPARCDVPGKTAGSHCVVCGYTVVAQIEIPALKHQIPDDWHCDEEEYAHLGHWHICINCGAFFDLESHSMDDGTETKAPTATTAGEKTYTCTACGWTRTETIPVTGGNDDPTPPPTPPPGPGPAPGPGPSGDITVEPTKYGITLPEEITDGTVKVDQETAEEGSEVTLTVEPKEGFRLSVLSVADSQGIEIELTDLESGEYTFIMPSSAVKVFVVFEKIPEEKKELPFTDVKEGSWYYDAVDRMYQEGLMTGTTETTFSPFAPTSRAMLVTILYRLEGEPTATDTTNFPDVKAKWCAPAVAWAAEHGIVMGYWDGLFRPNQEITREEVAVILFRYAQYKGWNVSARADLSGYNDSGKIHKYAQEAMEWLNAVGIMRGRDAVTLAPDGTANRAEIAVMMERVSEPKG